MAKAPAHASAPPVPKRNEPLDGASAARFGDKLGADFTGVQIHQGDRVAEARGASAVTFGSDIHFSDAAVASGSWKDGLLGHELVHTIQQGAVPSADGGRTAQGDTAATEAEAERVGRGAARGEAGQVSLRAPGEVQLYSPPSEQAPRSDEPQPAVSPAAPGVASQTQEHAGGATGTPIAESSSTSRTKPGGSDPASGAGTGSDPASGAGTGSARSAVGAPQGQRGVAAGSSGAPAKHPTAVARARPAPPLKGGTAGASAPPKVAADTHPRAATASAGAASQARGSSTALTAAGLITAASPPSPALGIPPTIRSGAPGAAFAQALAAEGNVLVQEIRTTASAAATQIRARGQSESARLDAERAAHATAIRGKAAHVRDAIAAHQQSASTSVHASQAAATTRVGATAHAQTAQVGQAAQVARTQAQQDADAQTARMDANIAAEGAQFHAASRTRDQQAQTMVGSGGESADMAAEASTKIGAKASETFAKDSAAVDAETQRAGSELRGVVAQGTASIHGELDQSHHHATQALSTMHSAAEAHLASSGQEVTSGLASFAANATGHVTSNEEAAAADMSVGVDAMIAALRDHAERQAAEIESKAAELAAAIASRSRELASSVADLEPEPAQAAATAARDQLGGLAARANAQIAASGGDVAGTIGTQAQVGSGAMATGATQLAGAMDQTGAAVNQRIAQTGAAATQHLQTTALSTTAHMEEAGTHSTTEMQQGASQFAANLQQGGDAAKTVVGNTVNKADGDQQNNAGTFQSKKQDAASQAASKHAEVRAEGDRKAATDSQSGGQAFLDWILPKSWTDAIKNWAKSFLGEWWTGFFWGLLNGLLALGVIILICAVTGPAAPFIIAACIGAALGAGIANRLNTYEAYHNGETPTGWDLVGSIGLGIADLTGIPNIIEGGRGYRFFSGGDTDPSRRMNDMEKGELVGGGIAAIIGLVVGARGLVKGGTGGIKPPEIKPPEIKPPEIKPPEVKPPEVKPPEVKPPEVKPPEGEPPVKKGPIPDQQPATLAEQITLQEAKAGQGREIMSNLGDEPRLVDNYGPGEWVKMEHIHKLPPEVGPKGKPVEPQINIHWFRNKTTGQNVEFKFKIRDPHASLNPPPVQPDAPPAQPDVPPQDPPPQDPPPQDPPPQDPPPSRPLQGVTPPRRDDQDRAM